MFKTRAVMAFMLLVASVAGFGGRAFAAPSTDEREAEVKLLQLINNERTNQALPTMSENDVIVVQARKHSNQMLNAGHLSHDGEDTRDANIAAGDSGISASQICELVASAGITNPDTAASRVFRAWKNGPERFGKCMFNGKSYTTQSAGVGVQFSGFRYYFTFMAAHDTTP